MRRKCGCVFLNFSRIANNVKDKDSGGGVRDRFEMEVSGKMLGCSISPLINSDREKKAKYGDPVSEINAIVKENQKVADKRTISGWLARLSSVMSRAYSIAQWKEEKTKPEIERKRGYMSRDIPRLKRKIETMERGFVQEVDEEILIYMLNLAFDLPEDQRIESVTKFVKKRENIKSAMQDLEDVNENCVYVVDTHRNLDNIAYWQLGYVMGRGIMMIGYYDGENGKNILEDVDQLTMASQSDDSMHFLELISCHITDIIGVLFSDWDKLYDVSKTELEAT